MKPDSPGYQKWMEGHQQDCQQNHFGSSGRMEAEGMVRIFGRSMAKRNLRYVCYCGEQDSSTMKKIWESDPYSVKVDKRECVCHIEKKMGRHLRVLRDRMKKQKLSDGKTLSGRGRLTDAAVISIQRFYGIAIRENTDSVPKMRDAIWAIYHHLQAEGPDDHALCPQGLASWCKYQKAVSSGDRANFEHKKPRIPPVCMQATKPVFETLTEEGLLNRCLGAFTQNNNESFHQLVWNYAPKTGHCGKRVVDIAVTKAILDFNGGQSAKKGLFQTLRLLPGKFFDEWAIFIFINFTCSASTTT